MGETTDTTVSRAAVAPDPMQMDDPNAIRNEIESTRAQMGATIDEIQDRLSPENLKNQAQEAIYDATVGKVENLASNAQFEVQNMGNSLMQTIRDNPMPAALAGFGLAWLFASGSNNNNRQNTRYGSPYPQNPPRNYAYQARAGWEQSSTQSALNDAQRTAQQKANQLQNKAQRAANQAQNQAQDAVENVQESAQQLADQAQQQWNQAQYEAEMRARQAQRTFYNQVEENPLLVGALAMGAGALIGMSLPTTQLENQYLGEYSDSAMEQVQETASQLTTQAKEAALQVKDTVVEEVKQSADDTNLSDSDNTDEAMRKAKNVALDAKDAALGEAKKQANKRDLKK